MIRRTLIAAAVLLGAATYAGAQERMPPGKWWQRPEVVRQLQLSRDQQEKLDAIFTERANALIDAKANVEKAQVALRAELDRRQLRRTEIQRLATQVNAARGKLFELELMMLVDMRGVLTEEQWHRLRMSFERLQQRREDGRPGPPGRRK